VSIAVTESDKSHTYTLTSGHGLVEAEAGALVQCLLAAVRKATAGINDAYRISEILHDAL
jgi:hypothetical protein